MSQHQNVYNGHYLWTSFFWLGILFQISEWWGIFIADPPIFSSREWHVLGIPWSVHSCVETITAMMYLPVHFTPLWGRSLMTINGLNGTSLTTGIKNVVCCVAMNESPIPEVQPTNSAAIVAPTSQLIICLLEFWYSVYLSNDHSIHPQTEISEYFMSQKATEKWRFRPSVLLGVTLSNAERYGMV